MHSQYHGYSQVIDKSNPHNLKTALQFLTIVDHEEVAIQVEIEAKSIPLDTLPGKTLQNVFNNSKNLKTKARSHITKSLNVVKNTIPSFKPTIKSTIQLKTIDVEFIGLVDSSYSATGSFAYLGNITALSNWSIGTIPVSFAFSNQSWSDLDVNRLLGSVRFDKDQYLQDLKKKLSKYDPAKFLQMPAEIAQKLAEQARMALSTDLQNLNDSYKGLLGQELASITGLQNLPAIDAKSLRKKLLSTGFVQQVLEKEQLLLLLQEKINTGEKINRQEFTSLQQEVMKLKAVRDFIAKIEEHQKKWESSGLLKKIKETGLLRTDKIRQMINDPSTIRKMAKEYLSLQGLERMFLNLNRMDIGQAPLNLSPLSFKGFLNNGIITEFLNKGKSVLLMLGRHRDLNSILDYNFNGSLNANNGFASAARIELSRSNQSSSQVLVSSFNQSLQNLIAPFDASAFRRTVVTTITSDRSIGQRGLLSIELSRSATQYRNQGNASDSTRVSGNPLAAIFSGEDLFANTAIGMKYSDEFPKTGLSYQINFNKLGNGYNNPGNSFLSNGTTEIGIATRKSLLKNRLIVSARTNNRVFSFDGAGNSQWTTKNTLVDARWKMKKGQYLGFRYQPTKMTKSNLGAKQLLSSTMRFSLDANLSARFNKATYRNLITLSYQESFYAGFGGNKSNSIMINCFQNLNLGKNLLYLNTSYSNVENNPGIFYLNTSALAEAGFTYQLFEKVTASSSLNFNSIKGWYNQFGIRQSLNGQLGEKISLNLFINAGKNFSVRQPVWEKPIRADLALRYFFGSRE